MDTTDRIDHAQEFEERPTPELINFRYGQRINLADFNIVPITVSYTCPASTESQTSEQASLM